MASCTSICGHTCYCTPFRSHAPFILDIGANRGEFSFQVQKMFGGNGVLVEANPNLIPNLITRFPERRIVNNAVAKTAGTLRFNISSNDEASSILTLPESERYQIHHSTTIEVASSTIEQLLQDIAVPVDLMKIDIEGAECEALTPPPELLVDRVSQICIEFHCAPAFGYDLQDQTETVIDSLVRMGFYAIDWSKGDLTDVLFVNTRVNRFFAAKYSLYQLREIASKLKRSIFPHTP